MNTKLLLSAWFACTWLPAQEPGRAQDPIGATIARAHPTVAEERWRLIPFGDSLVAALAQARELRKPVFFFGYDGILDCGYC